MYIKRNRGKNKNKPINLPCPMDRANAPFCDGALEPSKL